MAIVGAFDIHRRQLTFEYVSLESGELKRARLLLPTAIISAGGYPFRRREECRFRFGGVHRMALCGGRTRTGRCRSPSGGAGRYCCTSGQEASRQNRSCRHHASTFTSSGRRPPRELDTSGPVLEAARRIPSTRTCSMSAVTGINGYMPPVTTRGRQSSRASTPPRGEAPWTRSSFRRLDARPSKSPSARSNGSPRRWLGCAATWLAFLAANPGAAPCNKPTMVSARSPRWPSGRRWAIVAVSPTPTTPSATPAWT